MASERVNADKVKAYLQLLGNPYASLSIDGETENDPVTASSFDKERAYFRKLEDPHAHSSIFGEIEDNCELLRRELEEVLNLYKPYVAESDWSRVEAYRPTFLEKASENAVKAGRITKRLQELRFSLSPNEKVEYNRAPAARIIGELEKILISNR